MRMCVCGSPDVKVTRGYAGIMEFASCTACHCGLYQYPKGMDFVALFPTTFQMEQGDKGCALPERFKPRVGSSEMSVHYWSYLRFCV